MSIDGLVMPLLQDTADVGHGLVHVFLSDDGRNHGKGTESFVVQAADVVQADAADGDDGQAEVQGKGLASLLTTSSASSFDWVGNMGPKPT